MSNRGNADVLIVGAGPAALFAVFQLGIYGLRCHLVERLDRAGGQCTVLYPDKSIYDVPAFPEIGGDDLTERLLRQGAPCGPCFTFGRSAVELALVDGRWQLDLDDGTAILAGYVILATGIGMFDMPPGERGAWNLYRGRWRSGRWIAAAAASMSIRPLWRPRVRACSRSATPVTIRAN